MKASSSRLLTGLRVVIGLAVLAYLSLSGAIDWAALKRLAPAWPLMLAAFFILSAGMVVTAWRLCLLLKPMGLHLSLFASTRLTLIGIFFNLFLPGATGGDAVRIYYASAGNQGRRTELITIILLDRAIGMFALFLWPLLVAPLFLGLLRSQPLLGQMLLGAAVIVAAMVGFMRVSGSNRARQARLRLGRASKARFTSYLGRVLDSFYAYRNCGRTLLATVGLSLVTHTMAIGATLLLAQAINPSGFAWETAILIPLGFLANSLPVTPGGLGVGEAAFEALFKTAGLDGGAEILLAWRAAMLLVGMMGLVLYLQGRKRFVHPTVQPEVAVEG